MSLFRRKLLESYATNKLVYPGLIAAWSAKGKTNDDADRNVLKDLTGNGHDITLNNFAYSGMSGYGGYNADIFKGVLGSIAYERLSNNKILIKSRLMEGSYIINKVPCNGSPFTIKIDNPIGHNIKFVNGSDIFFQTKSEGIFEINALNVTSFLIQGDYKQVGTELNITLELLPEYPDALVFDGVDDYGSDVDFGDTTYVQTMIIKYLALTASPYSSYSYIRGNQSNGFFRINHNAIDKEPFIRVAVIPNKFYIKKDTDNFMQSAWDDNKHSPYSINGYTNGKEIGKMVFYSAYLFDRSLGEQEIKSFIRKHIDPEYLLPSEIPTPDVYYDFTNGDNSKGESNNVITDLSGNGNDATAHNFAWNEESGYAEGRLKFDGVDDYISLDTFDSVFKTMFMVCTNFEAPAGSILYDQRNELFNKNYSVAYYSSSIAYNNDNINGTYINGTLNTKLACQELNNKKHLIHVVAKDTSESRKPNIGRSLGQNQYSNMMLYKFLGFKEALTEEQIKAVINKYNLLDGVDNIDVN